MAYYRKIVGERVYLSPVDPADAGKYIAWMNERTLAGSFSQYTNTVASERDLAWLLAPLGYFAYILVRSTFAGDIGTTGTAFPYDFIDPAVHGGWGPMLIEVLFLAVGMAVLGYVIYALDRFLLHIKK